MNKNKDYLVNTMDGNDVYILTTINDETTNELVAQLAKWVNTLKPTGQSLKLYAPYAVIPNNHNVLNVYINSNGGKTLVLQSILTMFHMASAKGAIIKTYNLAHADSSASLLAISGTKGYRYMAEDAYNTVHFGNITSNVNHINEIEYSNLYAKNWYTKTQQIYLNNTKLTQKELNKYYNVEGAGVLNAKQCLAKGLCDWIITNDNSWINSVDELKTHKR